MRVAITGATGLIGTALCAHLPSRGHEPIRIVRGDAVGTDIPWDPAAGRLDPHRLDGVDAVVHLAGAGIADHRWTDDYKRQIAESRTTGTTLISEAIVASEDGPSVLLSGSAIGIYGARGDEDLDERSAPGDGFLADVTVQWERSTAAAEAAGVRVAHLRTGIVLSAHGGALKKQLPLFKFGLGGRMGSGDQWQSWITIDDQVAAITHLLDADTSGPVNLTAPNPVTNSAFTAALGAVLGRPTFMPIPKFGPRLLLGRELAENLLFSGQKVHSSVLQGDAGFEFQHAEIRDGLRSVLRS
ncbi:MAG: TIGR01777 family oxidoreductase [Ilumatobacteraceae bacterium]